MWLPSYFKKFFQDIWRCFYFKFLWNIVLYVEPFIPLFWTTGDIGLEFQCQGGSSFLHTMDSSDSPLSCTSFNVFARLQQSPFPHTFQATVDWLSKPKHWIKYNKQECIIVGCIPSAAVAVWWKTPPPRAHNPRVSSVGDLPKGVCAHRGYLTRGCLPGWCHHRGCLPRGLSAWGCLPRGYTSPLWTKFVTHVCEKITFPQLRLRTVITYKERQRKLNMPAQLTRLLGQKTMSRHNLILSISWWLGPPLNHLPDNHRSSSTAKSQNQHTD